VVAAATPPAGDEELGQGRRHCLSARKTKPGSVAAPSSTGCCGCFVGHWGQGVWPSQVYILKVAASRVYCPDRIAAPIQPW
jgi:hypothetical protein